MLVGTELWIKWIAKSASGIPTRDQKSRSSLARLTAISWYTYGDPTPPKAGLREGWDFRCDPALYIIGFEVERAVQAKGFNRSELRKDFGKNFRVRHRPVFEAP
jgi:hypothetical protein